MPNHPYFDKAPEVCTVTINWAQLHEPKVGDIILRYGSWVWSKRKAGKNRVGKILSFTDPDHKSARVKWDNGRVTSVQLWDAHYAELYEQAISQLHQDLRRKILTVKAFSGQP